MNIIVGASLVDQLYYYLKIMNFIIIKLCEYPKISEINLLSISRYPGL